MRYLVTVSYNGAKFKGWQKQPGERTVQGEIERVFSSYFDQKVNIHGSGRTDAEVHALGQVFHFDAENIDTKKFLYSLNKMLPSDIKLVKIKRVSDNFHARYNAKKKIYRFVITKDSKDPFNEDFVLLYPLAFDIEKLKEALFLFIGKHNFSAFTSKKEDEENFIRQIYALHVKTTRKKVTIDFIGNGFMTGQIRMMVGTALTYASGKIGLDYIANRLDSYTRQITSYKVSGRGLYLLKVIY